MVVKKNLVLLGMMGVGKSTLGKTVANKQGLEFIDTDFAIEKRCSMKISEIFKKNGFDKVEHRNLSGGIYDRGVFPERSSPLKIETLPKRLIVFVSL